MLVRRTAACLRRVAHTATRHPSARCTRRSTSSSSKPSETPHVKHKQEHHHEQQFQEKQQHRKASDADEDSGPSFSLFAGTPGKAVGVVAVVGLVHILLRFSNEKSTWKPAIQPKSASPTEKALQNPQHPRHGHDYYEHTLATDLQLRFVKALPLRFVSWVWGQVVHARMPLPLRQPLYGLWVKIYNCDMSESAIQDLREFETFAEFFGRQLRDGVRPQSPAVLTSPVDGRVLFCGEVKASDETMEQVKGIRYALCDFVGAGSELLRDDARGSGGGNSDTSGNAAAGGSEAKSAASGTEQPQQRRLLYCILYLSPGDYHRIHSPCDFEIHERRHFPGYLFPVKPSWAVFVNGLFALNERVTLTGRWEHGRMCIAPVGATNVGSIRLAFEPELRTNSMPWQHMTARSEFLKRSYQNLKLAKGDHLGSFDLGSTVVMIFDVPDGFALRIDEGDTVRVGQELGILTPNHGLVVPPHTHISNATAQPPTGRPSIIR